MFENFIASVATNTTTISFVICVLFFALSLFLYVARTNTRYASLVQKISFWRVAIAVGIFRIVYAALLTALQYYIWATGGALGQHFLSTPLSEKIPIEGIRHFGWLLNNKLGYFIFYSWGRFWLSALIVIVSSLIFYAFLRILKKKNERFFENGETELGLACALIAGWPGILIFISLSFLSVIIVSLFRLLIYKKQFTTLGYPFLLGLFLLLFVISFFPSLFPVGLLKI